MLMTAANALLCCLAKDAHRSNEDLFCLISHRLQGPQGNFIVIYQVLCVCVCLCVAHNNKMKFIYSIKYKNMAFFLFVCLFFHL